MNTENMVVTGTYTGDTAAFNLELGFLPRCVEILETNTPFFYKWFDSLGDASFIRMSTTTSGLTIYTATNGFTPWDGDAGEITLTGTAAGTIGGRTITGTSTRAVLEMKVGDTLRIDGFTYKVASIASATSFTVESNLLSTPSGDAIVRVNARSEGITLGTSLAAAQVHAWIAYR